jgi:hypothetical protein
LTVHARKKIADNQRRRFRIPFSLSLLGQMSGNETEGAALSRRQIPDVRYQKKYGLQLSARR